MAYVDSKHIGFIVSPSGASEDEMHYDDCLTCGAEWHWQHKFGGSGSQAHKMLWCGNVRIEIRKAIAKFNEEAAERRKHSRW